jgi:subtilase family serine protease
MKQNCIPPIIAACARRVWPFARQGGWLLLVVWATLSVHGAEMQTLQGHVLPVLKSLPPTGPLPATDRLNLAISLPLRNPAALSSLLQQIYDPANPNYHHYLTPSQFTEKFGPTEQDYQAVIAFAKANHLEVTTLHPNRLLLDVTGSVADVEKALHVTLHNYQHPTEQRSFYAPDGEPSLALEVPVLHISGLDNYALPRPHLQANRLVSGQNASANGGSGPGGTFMGADFRNAYVPDTTLNGSGQVVGLLQFDGYTASDITYYESLTGLPKVPLQNVLLDGFNGNPTYSGGEVEVSLDIEMVISMATNLSKVIVYEAPTNADFHDILNRMANDNLARQLSCSWYIPGGGADTNADQIFQQMAAQGQSFFNASGDDDAYTGLISFPGDSPFITQVGGTTLTTSPTGGWDSETVWNSGIEYGSQYDGIGSGGGISTQYPIPSWQTNISMVANQGSTTMRNTPDVAMTADNIYVRADGVDLNEGGTSCAAPLWAGFAALVNQQAASIGQPAIGFINPAVAAIGSSACYSKAFHDITTGNNTWSNSPSKFYAVSGYDLCTGWGTPAGQSLINALANPEALRITPSTGFSAIGGVGGPFTVISQSYSLTNIGTNTLTWTLSNTSAWFLVSSSSGTLTPGGPATTVTMSLNNVASNLVVGIYNATIWFTNQNDNIGQSRPFTLSVISPPSITQQPTNQAVLEGATADFSVQAAGGLPLAYQWQINGTNLTDGGNIFGSATTNLTVSNVSTAEVGIYTVVVTNYAGAVTSSNATLTIIESPPVIVLQPTNQTVFMGATVKLAVGVIGTMPFSYQWNFNGTNVVNATNATLTLPTVQLANSGDYSVSITNLYGSTNSEIAVVTVNGLPCDPVPSGIVAWWQAEDNALDSVGGNNGTLMNGTGFTNGEVGMAFNLNGVNNFVLANPAAPGNLDVGQGSGFTMEGWINPTTTANAMPLFGYERILGSYNGPDAGVMFYISVNPPTGTGAGCLVANILDTTPAVHNITSNPGVVIADVWQHVALTYDRNSGSASIYLNGSVVVQANLGSFIPQTSFTNLLLGGHTLYGSVSNPSEVFSGGMDELSLYNRALSSNEIAAIYLTGNYGKCFTPTPPVITTQPTNQMVAVGGTAVFIVTAGGTPPLYYQWSFNGTNIVSATNATLTLTNVQFNQSGNYSVLVTNLYGSTNSAIAVLTVYGLPPVLITQPTNETVIVGSTASFSVTASGTPPLYFQWSFNGTNIVNATNATLTLPNVQLTNSGDYSVLITNLYGSTNSAIAVLTVNPLPTCDPAPSGIVAWWQAEGNALDSVGGNNGKLMNGTSFTNGEVGMAFHLNGVNNFVLANPTAPGNFDIGQGSGFTIEGWINPTTTSPAMIISVYEKALGTSIGSDESVAFVMDNTPNHGFIQGCLAANIVDTTGVGHVIGSPANSVVVGVWQHVALSYDKASGIAVLYANGTSVAQANLGTFTPQTSFTNVEFGGQTTYASISNPANVFSGRMDELSLYNRALSSNEIAAIYLAGSVGKCPLPPMILNQPTNQSVNVNASATFKVVASGTPPLAYQWSFNSTNILNATNATLTLTGVQFTNAGNYSVLVANGYGATNSSNAVLTVQAAPTITLQPTNLTVAAGGSASFSVTVSGTPPLNYQWYFNTNRPVPGATNATLTLADVQLTNGGCYSVRVTNLFGSATSSNALLIVQAPPVILTQPTNLIVNVGGVAVFSSAVNGSSPLNYQWSLNMTNIPAATNAGLTISNVQLASAGVYVVTVTNAFGIAVSSNAALTVIDLLDHFTWSPVPSPRFVNAPFAVTIQALDSINQLFTNFTGTVALAGTNGTAVNPPVSTSFTQGVWSGTLTITQAVANLVVRANDGAGHVGLANPINVIATPSLAMARSGGSLLIFWPVDPAGFVLETSPTLVPPQWIQVAEPPLPIGNQYLESIQLNYTNQYYRLRFTLP